MDTLITIPYQWPSQNVYDRMHWAKRHRATKQIEMLIRSAIVASACKAVQPRLPAQGFRWVRLVRYSRQRITDNANLRGGAKGIVDAIKRCGLIEDDKDSLLHVYYEQDVLSECAWRFGGVVKPCVRIEVFQNDPFPGASK